MNNRAMQSNEADGGVVQFRGRFNLTPRPPSRATTDFDGNGPSGTGRGSGKSLCVERPKTTRGLVSYELNSCTKNKESG